jgi:hypothetical protein
MLLGIYLGALALGGILIGASILLGGHDAGADHDASHEIAADHDGDAQAEAHVEGGHGEAAHEAASWAITHANHHALERATGHAAATTTWLPFLSLRFWTFGLASFGLTGALLYALWSASALTLAFSIPMGLGIGTGVAALFRWLQTSTTGGPTPVEDLRGTEGILLLSAGPGHLGKVRLHVAGQHVDLLATTRDPDLLPVHARVIVVDLKDGVADVTAALPGEPQNS